MNTTPSSYYFGDVHHHYNQSIPPNDEELLKKVHQLQQDLQQQALIATGQVDLPVGLSQALKPVSLQIKSDIQKPHDLSSKGQYRRRSEFEKLFTVGSESLNLHQLFLHAKRLADEEAGAKCTNDVARQAWIETHSNIVGAVGHPGMGKTTLAKLLAQNILQKLVLPDTEMVFFIPLRLLSFSKEISLIQFLLSGSYCRWDSNVISDKFLLEYLEKSKIVVLVDGLDEGKFDEASRVQPVSNDRFATADVFLKNILAGHLLRSAKKLITSRPNAMYNLHPDYRPHCTVEILGLSRMSQDDLSEQICGPDFSKQVKNQLYQHPELSSFSHVPIYCIMTVCCILENVQSNNDQAIISKTDVLMRVLLRYLRTSHSRTRGVDLSKLALLAWSGLNSETAVFSDDDLTKANVNREDYQAFLHTYIDDISALQYTVLEGDKKTSFSHLLWQEILGSCYAMFFMPLDVFKTSIDSMNKPSFSVVATFMFGLCNKQVFSQARKVFPCICEDHWHEKVALLQSLAVFKAGKIAGSLNEKAQFCRVCRWAKESQNEEIVKSVATSLPEAIYLVGTLLPNEVSSMQTVLETDNTLCTLSIGQKSPRGLYRVVKFADSGLLRFLENFAPMVNSKAFQVPGMCVWLTSITEVEIGAMQPFLTTLTEVVLWECDLEETEATCICNLLKEHNKMLNKLDLSVNNIGDNGAAAISTIVHLVEDLFLRNCNITGVGAVAIANEMGKDNNLVHTLNMAFNKIGNVGVAALAQNLRKFKVLDLHDCEITERGMCAIGKSLTQCNKISMTVSGNNIGDEGIKHLKEHWNRLDNISIADCGLSEECICSIDAKIQELTADAWALPVIHGLNRQSVKKRR